jgi:hypothetical protein
MSDGLTPSTTDVAPAADPANDELARTLGSIWRRFCGRKPRSTNVAIERDVIRLVIEEGEADPEPDPDADGEAAEVRLSQAGLKQQATATVARMTGRRVVGFIVKSPKQSDTSTQTFLLERPSERF